MEFSKNKPSIRGEAQHHMGKAEAYIRSPVFIAPTQASNSLSAEETMEHTSQCIW